MIARLSQIFFILYAGEGKMDYASSKSRDLTVSRK